MRRIPAISLLLAISCSLIAPLLVSAEPDSDLPECCRRDGKHHCSMADMPENGETAASGDTLRIGPSRCQQYPKASLAAREITAVSSTRAPIGAALPKQITVTGRAVIHPFFNPASSCHKRGPPSFLS